MCLIFVAGEYPPDLMPMKPKGREEFRRLIWKTQNCVKWSGNKIKPFSRRNDFDLEVFTQMKAKAELCKAS